MKKTVLYFVSLLCAITSCGTHDVQTSPNQKLTLNHVETDSTNEFTLNYRTDDGKDVVVMNIPMIGITTENGRGTNLEYKKVKGVHRHIDDYTMLSGKRLVCHNEANEYTYIFNDATGAEVRMVFRLYNDGLAFRYEMDGLENDLVNDEQTTYLIEEGRNRWIQKFELGYEEFYTHRTTGKSEHTHWIYPALLEKDGVWTLITEAGINKGHSASSMRNEGHRQHYKLELGENKGTTFTGNWVSPWRVLIVGSLADVTESTLVTDVSDECRVADAEEWICPGTASWVYWAYNHGSKDFAIVDKYIDMAHTLNLPYVLIDWEWDIMGNGGNIDDACRKAKDLGIRPLVWYNSTTAWIQGAGGPKWKLNKAEDREREFAWLAEKGIAGVKVDFFDGDKRATMDYCIDILESAARHHLLVNFHGATLPRGWQRTYPNLVSVEAVYGAEWYNNTHTFAPKAAVHNTTLPFTRNVVGPMDYTPCAFSDSQHPHFTTHAHELALTVVFESAIQHLADRPESFLAQPQEVQNFLSTLPTVWDETKLLSGYPGEWVAMARRNGNTWYVGVLNGKDEKQSISIDWNFLSDGNYSVQTFGDVAEEARAWNNGNLTDVTPSDMAKTINLEPRGGYVAVIKK